MSLVSLLHQIWELLQILSAPSYLSLLYVVYQGRHFTYRWSLEIRTRKAKLPLITGNKDRVLSIGDGWHVLSFQKEHAIQLQVADGADSFCQCLRVFCFGLEAALYWGGSQSATEHGECLWGSPDSPSWQCSVYGVGRVITESGNTVQFCHMVKGWLSFPGTPSIKLLHSCNVLPVASWKTQL